MRRSSLMKASLLGCMLGYSCVILLGCGGAPKPYEPEVERRLHTIAVRPYAPEPVYKRVRLGNPPEPLPSGEVPRTGAPLILPVVHMQVASVTLEEAARILAGTARYTSYAASTVADKKVSMNDLGTVDELAKRLAEKTGTHVVVDHATREVRFLANNAALEPKLFDEKVEDNEHQSDN